MLAHGRLRAGRGEEGGTVGTREYAISAITTDGSMTSRPSWDEEWPPYEGPAAACLGSLRHIAWFLAQVRGLARAIVIRRSIVAVVDIIVELDYTCCRCFETSYKQPHDGMYLGRLYCTYLPSSDDRHDAHVLADSADMAADIIVLRTPSDTVHMAIRHRQRSCLEGIAGSKDSNAVRFLTPRCS